MKDFIKDFNFIEAVSPKQSTTISTGLGIFIIIFSILLVFGILYPYYYTANLEQQLAYMQDEVQRAGAANASKRAIASKLEKQVEILNSIKQTDISYPEAEARLIMLFSQDISIRTLSYTDATMKMSCSCPNVSTIVSFIQSLNNSGYYTDIMLNNLAEEKNKNEYTFDISAQIMGKGK